MKYEMFNKISGILAIMLIVAMVTILSGCSDQRLNTPLPPGVNLPVTDQNPTLEEDIEVKTFSSVEELEGFLSGYDQGSDGYYGGRGLVMFDAVAEMAAPNIGTGAMVKTMEDSASYDSGSRDFSETNVQVKGIDEADIIKTDGEYIYTISGNILYIIKAYPGEDAKIMSTIDFKNTPSNLFIKEDKLAVFGTFYDLEFFKKLGFVPDESMTFLNIYDTSDKEDPELIKEFKFEGSYSEGRMKGSDMYIITTTYDHNSPLPIIFEDNVKSSVRISDIYYYNIPYNSPIMSNIHTIDIDSLESDSKSVIVEGSQSLYMSHDNIYITYTEYINEWEIESKIRHEMLLPLLTLEDSERIIKIEATDSDVLTVYEKKQKIYQITSKYYNYMLQEERDLFDDKVIEVLKEKMEEYKHLEYTIIHQINLKEGTVEIGSNGKVPGHVINQFSMDEHEGVFRIATTISQRWDRYYKERSESVNNIYTLDMDLKMLDSLEGLAEGENIYSTRFMGDKLYMVTFKQVDPFFVIDLSDPEDIKNMGELKIPGFSRYLHPYDENTIIGIGQEATDSGRTTGLKISLFDVSDMKDPKEIAKFVAEGRYSSSTAEYEHKAFLFSKEKNLLVIPAYSYDWESNNGYNGAMVFDISKDDIELRGIIDHSTGDKYYGSSVERSLYIEDMLYTKSFGLLRINSLEDLESVGRIELKGKSDYKIY